MIDEAKICKKSKWWSWSKKIEQTNYELLCENWDLEKTIRRLKDGIRDLTPIPPRSTEREFLTRRPRAIN